MTDFTEEWRPSLSLPGYFVSSLGRVRFGSHWRILTGTPHTKTGYWRLNILRPGVRGKWALNRIVCEAFHGPAPSPEHHAAHGDNNKDNNREDNLRWATPKENVADQILAGTFISGERHPSAKLTTNQANEIKSSDESRHALAARFGISLSLVDKIRHGQRWKHGVSKNQTENDDA